MKKYIPYSDFSFLSLFTYNTNDSAEYCRLNGNLVIKYDDYITGEEFYSILGKWRLKSSIKTLLASAKSRGMQPVLRLVPEATIKNGKKLHEHWKIEEDESNFDYIISSLDLAELSGEKLPKKKKLVDDFKAKYPHLKVKPLDLTSKAVQKNILKLFDDWAESEGHQDGEAEVERKALTRLLVNSNHFDKLYALGIYDKQQLVAFNTYEIATHEHGISSFQKADRTYDGIYAMLTHEMAKDLARLGCKYINFEQDLGKEGLRASKRSWHPVNILKKYTIS